MRRRNFTLAALGLAIISLAILRAADEKQIRQDRLWRHRNLGKAFYENPAGSRQAVEEFRKALDFAPDSVPDRLNYGLALLRAGQTKEGMAELEAVRKVDPKLPHTWFNLGISCKKLGMYPEAIQQLEAFVKLVPGDAVAHHNLGLLYNLTGQPDLAMKKFELANRLDPRLVAPYYQIYNAHRLADRPEQSAAAMKAFLSAKEKQQAAGESEDIEWNDYAEVYEVIEPAPAREGPPPAVKFEHRPLSGRADAATVGLLSFDADGDDKPDLLVWSRAGLHLYRGGADPVPAFGADDLRGVTFAAAGDYDNDGLADLCLLTDSEAILYHNAKGTFAKAAAPLAPKRFESAVWLDYDHDYDLDLILLGEQCMLLRNQGASGFTDQTAAFPFLPGRALSAAPIALRPDAKGTDLVVSYAGRPGVLYRDLMRGQFKSEDLNAIPAQARSLAAVDAGNDGWLDLLFSDRKGAGLLANRKGSFERAPVQAEGSGSPILVDLESRGFSDLVLDGAVFRNLGAGAFSPRRSLPAVPSGAAIITADFDQDGRPDLATVSADGRPHLLLNRTEPRNQWLAVSLSGAKNLKEATGSQVEVKAGAFYQKKIYEGVPLLFGLGTYREVDAVRVTWPNGMIQNLTAQAASATIRIEEAPRLSGSCPMIFTWNGREFQFITDVLGVAPLGAGSPDGGYFPVDHDEYVQIPGGALALENGRYEVRITEELREVSYLDKIQLIALDHQKRTEIYTSEKFKSPPFPDFRLYGVDRRLYPVRAADHRGRQVLPRLLRRDRAYPDGFQRNVAGIAEMHYLDLDFGQAAASANSSLLVLNGWVDWADGSTFLAASQEGNGGLVFPYLQVKDSAGKWRTVIEDMGIPAGKPKTIVVDLTGKFLSKSREVRIVTNLCVYWDEIFLSENTAPPAARLSPLKNTTSELRFRGFSRAVIHPLRTQPERFDYAPNLAAAMWNPTSGLYTRFGEVRELLQTVDDRFVIMGSGDELRLLFDASQLPAPPAGWTRDFLLHVDGWAKDGDAGTAFSDTVEPLPFHAMSRYPYPGSEKYPGGPLHSAYREAYNTRPALRLIRPLR